MVNKIPESPEVTRDQLRQACELAFGEGEGGRILENIQAALELVSEAGEDARGDHIIEGQLGQTQTRVHDVVPRLDSNEDASDENILKAIYLNIEEGLSSLEGSYPKNYDPLEALRTHIHTAKKRMKNRSASVTSVESALNGAADKIALLSDNINANSRGKTLRQLHALILNVQDLARTRNIESSEISKVVADLSSKAEQIHRVDRENAQRPIVRDPWTRTKGRIA
jgi:chromosome segregation ATPase